MWKCSKCDEECEDTFDSCWNCGTERGGSPPVAAQVLPEQSGLLAEPSNIASSRPSSTPKPSKRGGRSVLPRYMDAYLVARAIVAVGLTVKVSAFVIGAGVVLILLATAGSESARLAIGSLGLGIIVGIPIYVLGILVGALGQILKATLDTAVNTSPLLTKDEILKIMSLD
jgi:hypothetical protein